MEGGMRGRRHKGEIEGGCLEFDVFLFQASDSKGLTYDIVINKITKCLRFLWFLNNAYERV